MLALVCGTFATMSFGATVYFAPEARGAADGSSAENAKVFSMTEINKCKEGSVIQLCDGKYSFSGQNQFTCTKFVFQGNPTDRSAVEFDGGGNAQFSISDRPGVTIKDVTIRRANSTGGAISLSGTTVALIENCAFISCTNANYGGAIRVASTSGNVVSNCYFESCKATSGGGAISLERKAYVYDCYFTNNVCVAGGALFLRDTSQDGSVISGCEFVGNASERGSNTSGHGGVLQAAKSFYMTNCVFTANTSLGLGSVIRLSAGNGGTVSGCLFNGNKMTGTSACGGVIAVEAGTFEVDRCTFQDNTSATYAAGVFQRESKTSHVKIRNSLFVGNVAVGRGNSVFVGDNNANSSTVVENCTFVDNKCSNNSGDGFAPVRANSGPLSVTNCAFWNNTDKSGKLWAATAATAPTIAYTAADATLTGDGCVPLTASPFTDAANGDYTLPKKVGGAPNPCLGAGVKLDWMTKDSKDLAGNPRLRGDDIVDLGCYEFFQKSGVYLIFR